MDKLTQIRLQIGKLQDQKENQKFGYNQFAQSELAVLIFLGTICITVFLSISVPLVKLITIVCFLAAILLSHQFYFKPQMASREKKLYELAKKIQDLYDELLT